MNKITFHLSWKRHSFVVREFVKTKNMVSEFLNRTPPGGTSIIAYSTPYTSTSTNRFSEQITCSKVSEGVRSRVLAMTTFFVMSNLSTHSRMAFTSNHVTPPTTNNTTTGWSSGRGLLTFMKNPKPVFRKSFKPCEQNSISTRSVLFESKINSNIWFTMGVYFTIPNSSFWMRLLSCVRLCRAWLIPCSLSKNSDTHVRICRSLASRSPTRNNMSSLFFPSRRISMR